MEDQPLNSLNVAGFAVFTRLDERNKPILCPREEANPGTGWMPDGYERIYRGPTLSVARAAALAAADRIVSEDEDRRLGVTISETALPNGEGVVLVHVEDEEYQDDPGRSVFDAFQEEFGFGAFRPARLDVDPSPARLAEIDADGAPAANRALSAMIASDLAAIPFRGAEIVRDVQAEIERVPGAWVSFVSRDAGYMEDELVGAGKGPLSEAEPELIAALQAALLEAAEVSGVDEHHSVSDLVGEAIREASLDHDVVRAAMGDDSGLSI